MTITSEPNAGTDTLEGLIVAAIKKWIAALRDDVDSLVAAGVPQDEWARLVRDDIAPHVGAEFIATSARSLPSDYRETAYRAQAMSSPGDTPLAWPEGVEGPDTIEELLAEYPLTFQGIDPRDVILVVAQPSWVQKFNTYMRETQNLVVGMGDTTFQDMQKALSKVGQGAGLFEKQEAVREFLSWEEEGGYVGWMKRAERIARTEVATARNSAAHAAALELADSGVPVMKRWSAARDEYTRDTHLAAHGQVVEIHDPFAVGDDRLDHPGDREHGSARETINCRCVCDYLEYMTLEEAQAFGAELLEEEGVTMNDTIAAAGAVAAKEWEGRLAPLGEPTGDGRIFATEGEYRFREFPLPLLWQETTGEGHDASRVVGTIDSGEIAKDGVVARGTVFSDEEKVLALLEKGVIRPSVDLCDMVAEVFADEDDPEGPGTLHISSATVMAATLVAKPAFENVNVTLTGDDTTVEQEGLVAAAVALQEYNAVAFRDPRFDKPTPVTVTSDGYVAGHLALWDSCHVGMPNRCVQPPRSSTGYASFHQSTVRTDEGPLAVGRLTVGGGHADARAGFRAAAEHYDQTGATWAMVRAGEDEHGIWISGQVHPDATAAQVQAGSEAPLSGDWRRIGGSMELVAALSVSTPGFPVRREYTAEDGGMGSLVAAAQVQTEYAPGGFLRPGQFRKSDQDVTSFAREVVAEMKRSDRQDRLRRASAPFRQERARRVMSSAREVFGKEVN